MSVNAGQEKLYEERHNPIWPELQKVSLDACITLAKVAALCCLLQTLKEAGAHNYSIFLHPETRQLFAYVELDSEVRKLVFQLMISTVRLSLDAQEKWNALSQHPVVKRWWKHMSPLMPSAGDATSPDKPVSIGLKEVFHMP